jgi:UDP-N-acetylglucosamine diphosphorylase/glucosamine-1-phosphate N-acetyltransferase
MTDLRASFEVRTGMLSTAGRIARRIGRPVGAYWMPPPLDRLVAGRSGSPVNVLPAGHALLLVNGRCAQPAAAPDLRTGQALVVRESGHVVAAKLPWAAAEQFLKSFALPDQVDVVDAAPEMLFTWPWEVLARLPESLVEDISLVRLLDAKVPGDDVEVVGSEPVEVHRAARVYPSVVFDVERGPIVVHEDAVIRPGAILCGPCSVGHGSTVLDRALVKPNTVIGPRCKVAGEVGATIFQGYANKAHDGHLGDSWIGAWVNLGADTTNSNLLNTYGEVAMRVETDGPRRRTGMTFLGAVIGDHVKTAIGTRLMTGTVIGTGAMIATTAPPPATVRRFAWLTDDGERTYRLAKLLGTAEAVMARRDRELDEPERAAITDLHARTVGGR